jgi:hypothetical protein
MSGNNKAVRQRPRVKARNPTPLPQNVHTGMRWITSLRGTQTYGCTFFRRLWW